MLPSLYPPLVRSVIYPAYRGLRGDRLISFLEELEKNQWLSPGEIDDIQWRRLERFSREVTRWVPYYREPSGARASRRTISRAAPISGRCRFSRRRRPRRREPDRLDGSAAEGRRVEHGRHDGGASLFLRGRCRGAAPAGERASGCDGPASISATGRRSCGDSSRRPVQGAVRGRREGLFQQSCCYLSSFDMSDATMHRYASRLRAFKPDLISAIRRRRALRGVLPNRRIAGIRPRAMFRAARSFSRPRGSSSGRFSLPGLRSVREPGVRERRAGVRRAQRASRLQRSLLRRGYRRERRAGGEGEVGEIVVTDLFNLYMPFIRYRTGDLAVSTRECCPCGRGFPLLDRVEGRRSTRSCRAGRLSAVNSGRVSRASCRAYGDFRSSSARWRRRFPVRSGAGVARRVSAGARAEDQGELRGVLRGELREGRGIPAHSFGEVQVHFVEAGRAARREVEDTSRRR